MRPEIAPMGTYPGRYGTHMTFDTEYNNMYPHIYA